MAEQKSLSPGLTPESESRWSVKRITMIALGAVIGVIVLVLLIGILLALFSDVEQTAPRVQVIRDVFIIILAMQGILVVVALAVLILQVARLINLLQSEILPLLDNTRDTLNSARGTVEFVSANLTGPVVKAGGFMAGVRVLVRELGGIRRAVRHGNHRDEPTQ